MDEFFVIYGREGVFYSLGKFENHNYATQKVWEYKLHSASTVARYNPETDKERISLMKKEYKEVSLSEIMEIENTYTKEPKIKIFS